MAPSKPTIKMTLGSELASEPPAGAGIIAEKDGSIWAFIHTASRTTTPSSGAHWVSATIKEAKFYHWTTIRDDFRILVVFETDDSVKRVQRRLHLDEHRA